jgi:molybdopterin molybdotransferase
MARNPSSEHVGNAPQGKRRLTVDEALEHILASVRPVAGRERSALREALGRVLDEDIRAAIDVPAHTNSAMDGYAVPGADLPASGERRLRIVGTAFAGRPFAGSIAAGECVRIMTGAPLPGGADTIVIQEDVATQEDCAIVGSGHRVGQHVRRAGEDLRAGAVALAAGTRLEPAHLGVLASIGIGDVAVRRRVRVAFFSTGDELRSVGDALAPGEIYDSNRYTLWGMLARLGVEILDLGVIRDRLEDVERALEKAAAGADAIVTSGGVSVGEADLLTRALEKIGEIGFWKVAMKPGKPVAFGRIGAALYFGLPGNPVSVMTTFYELVQPALVAMSGARNLPPPVYLTAVCTSTLRKQPGRQEFQRGILERDRDGRYRVRSVGSQGAGILHSMTDANCFIVLALDAGTVPAGSEVCVRPFAAFV